MAAEPAARDIGAWRKAERERLIAARLAMPADERAAIAEKIMRDLDGLIAPAAGTIVSLYWPFRGEPDLRPWMERAVESGAQVALPVVVGKAQPLVFRAWQPGARLERGVWNIPFPADGEVVVPNVVIAPLVGFDAGCFRLGYGGGFFDRTLAGLPQPPTAIGVGYAMSALETIHPQAYDIAMSFIVTGTAPPLRRPGSSVYTR